MKETANRIAKFKEMAYSPGLRIKEKKVRMTDEELLKILDQSNNSNCM